MEPSAPEAARAPAVSHSSGGDEDADGASGFGGHGSYLRFGMGAAGGQGAPLLLHPVEGGQVWARTCSKVL